ncbi:MAG: hypothetical protein R3E86_10395 [Pseudomonadales bacterium]
MVSNVRRTVVHFYAEEEVSVITAPAGREVRLAPREQVQELLVLGGQIELDGERFGPRSWLRFPVGQTVTARALTDARLFHKTRPEFAIAQPEPEALAT